MQNHSLCDDLDYMPSVDTRALQSDPHPIDPSRDLRSGKANAEAKDPGRIGCRSKPDCVNSLDEWSVLP